jgi:hypothetical protein
VNSATVAHSQPTFPRARGFQQLHFRFTRATFCVSVLGSKLQKVPMAFVEGLTVAVCNTLKWLKSSVKRLSENSSKTPKLIPRAAKS